MEHELFMINSEGSYFRVTIVCRNRAGAGQLEKLVYEVAIDRDKGETMTVQQMFDEAQQVFRLAKSGF